MPIRSRLSINTAEAAIDAAIAGVGVTRVLQAIAVSKLQVVLSAFEPTPVPVSIIYANRKSRYAAAKDAQLYRFRGSAQGFLSLLIALGNKP